jgi:hypothetical protein
MLEKARPEQSPSREQDEGAVRVVEGGRRVSGRTPWLPRSRWRYVSRPRRDEDRCRYDADAGGGLRAGGRVFVRGGHNLLARGRREDELLRERRRGRGAAVQHRQREATRRARLRPAALDATSSPPARAACAAKRAWTSWRSKAARCCRPAQRLPRRPSTRCPRSYAKPRALRGDGRVARRGALRRETGTSSRCARTWGATTRPTSCSAGRSWREGAALRARRLGQREEQLRDPAKVPQRRRARRVRDLRARAASPWTSPSGSA